MNDRRFFKPLLTLLALVLLVGVNFAQRQLTAERTRLKLTRVEADQSMPPAMAFTAVALGGFRGLVSNALWIRLNDLQLDEKYFEMVQLSDWITKMQPHFVAVWVHQAWNLSYNISVKFPDPNDRWFWVNRGIELLRDEALKYNPNETLIYRELAWHFQHKMGANLDNAHMTYKREWARQMTEVFGSQSKPNWEELLSPQTDEARLRTKLLREKYKMDPKLAREVDEQYGPLEWRLPETHAVYWASLGLKNSKAEQLITLRRVIYQSMQLAAQRGRLIYNPVDKFFEFGPNLVAIPMANEGYEQMQGGDPANLDNIKNAHANFLKQAITDLYLHNREQDAARWHDYLGKKYVGRYTKPGQTVTEFVLERYKELMDLGKDKVQSAIEGMFMRHFYELAIGEDDRAQGYVRLIREIHREYAKKVERSERDRVDLPPLATLRKLVLDRLVDAPAGEGWNPQMRLQLLTALNLPVPKNAPWLTAPATGTAVAQAGTNRPSTYIPPSVDLNMPETNLKLGKEFLAKNKQQADIVERPSGLQYRVVTAGSGKLPTEKSKVRVHYTGKVIDKKTLQPGGIFDSSYEKNLPAEFDVTGVIKGWTEALLLMPKGSKWQLFIPHYLAYGERGSPPGIGPNEVLYFEIELLDILGK
ncbi:MAG: FKBP-type peptidyl-prolyl cis-trans isomerase [Verrucomicrobia bacterium]|nr:FKBP-type peptidyl-prolyl cis-trans isomerase [Verrucomicrobiota bacterium]